MKLKNSIANKLTKHLIKVMAISAICIFVISIAYSLVMYRKYYQKNREIQHTFLESILPVTTRDMLVGSLEEMRVRTEFFVLREKADSLQVKIEDLSGKTLYQSDGYKNQCDTLDFFKLNRTLLVCEKANIEYLSRHLGQIWTTKEIQSFGTFFVDTKVLFLFSILFVLFSFLLVLIRQLLKTEVVVPLNDLIYSLDEGNPPEAGNHWAGEWIVLHQSISSYKNKIVQYATQQWKNDEALQKEKLLSEVTSQLAHDIRSPLAALDMIVAHVPELDEEKRILIRGATERIHNIANNLIERNFTKKHLSKVQMISSLVRSLVLEKKQQYRTKGKISIAENIEMDAYGVFAKVEADDFKRILSNLVDNAVQAIADEGTIIVNLSRRQDSIWLEIKDTGKGISADKLPKVGTKGFTFDKEGGTGLGLYYVVQKMKEWGGKCEITSQVNQGTNVKLILKNENPPNWYTSEIVVNEKSKFVILDDDNTIHEVWKTRLKSVILNPDIYHFESEGSFTNWFNAENKNQSNILFFCDYELIGNKHNGLDIIEKSGIAAQSILITSHYENENIQKRCEMNGIRMIPKQLAGFVPILKE